MTEIDTAELAAGGVQGTLYVLHQERLTMLAKTLRDGCLAIACMAFASVSLGQSPAYPSRPIKLIVPNSAGGPTDVIARVVADGLTRHLGQPVVIDNRAGAGGVLAARALAAAAPDGYTLLLGNTATLATIPATSKSAGYDPIENFAAVVQIANSYQVVVTRPDLPITSVADLVSYARSHAGAMNFGAAGIGNITHLSGELLKSRTGIDFVTAQYKSGAESLNALLGGQIDFAIDNIAAVRALVEAGKLRALAVTSASRQPELAALPTMAEAGVKDYVVTSFFGIVAPAKTPPAIVRRINEAVGDMQSEPAFKTSLVHLGAAAAPGPPERLRQLMVDENRKWSDLAKSAHIAVD